MRAALEWAGDDDDVPAPVPLVSCKAPLRLGDELPRHVAARLWRGSELGSPITSVVSSGLTPLDAELPGGGWPCRSLTEVLQPQPSVAEWRLLAPAMRRLVDLGQDVVVVGPPKSPHLPGLRHVGLDERRLVWVQSEAPAERLWVVALKSVPGGLGGILTPRLQRPSLIIASRQARAEPHDVVGSPAPRQAVQRRVAAH